MKTNANKTKLDPVVLEIGLSKFKRVKISLVLLVNSFTLKSDVSL